MNKKMTLLLLCVVACAMGIVMFSQVENITNNSPFKASTNLGSIAKTDAPSTVIIPTIPPNSNASKPNVNAKTTNSTPKDQMPNNQALEQKELVKIKEVRQPRSESVTLHKIEETKPKPQAEKKTQDNSLSMNQQTKLHQPAVEKEKSKEEKKVNSPTATVSDSEKKNSSPDVKVREKEEKALPIPKSDVTHGINGTHEMKTITVRLSGAKVIVHFEAKDAFAYKTMILTGPDRLVIDFPGKWGTITPPAVPQNRLVEKMRVGNQPVGPRIVLDFRVPPKKYEFFKVSNSIIELVIE